MKFFETPNDLDGYGVEIEIDDLKNPLDLPELKGNWADILWEGVTKKDGRYHAYYLTTNTYLLTFKFPDCEWLGNDLRENLEKHRSDVGVSYSEVNKTRRKHHDKSK